MVARYDEFEPDGDLSPEVRALVDNLSPNQLSEIDNALLSNCLTQWRKVAAVVGFTMTNEFMAEYPGIPDVFFSQRVRSLVDRGILESEGNLSYMRYSEVRLARTSSTHTET